MNGLIIKELPLNEMAPFIRFIHAFEILENSPFLNVVPYDYRLIYVVGGKGAMEIDGRRYEAYPGCLFLWHPGVAYSYLPEPAHPFSLYGINFDFTHNYSFLSNPVSPDKKEVFKVESIIERVCFSDFEGFNRIVRLENQFLLEDKLKEMTHEYMTRKNFYTLRIRGLFLSFMSEVARSLALRQGGEGTSNGSIDAVLEFIHLHYSKPLSNDLLGKAFSFHPGYLNRLIKRHTGMSLHQYLLGYRLSVALGLLQTTGLSVTEIAQSCGFTDINYFSRSFKKHTGKRPGDFKLGKGGRGMGG